MRTDMTQAQFDAACQRWGFKKGWLGYYHIPGHPVEVNVLNAGPGASRRAKLAYLIGELRKHDAKAAARG